MLSFTVRMRFPADHHDQVAAMLQELTRASRQEPGCINYICHFVETDPTTVLIYEQYVDEAALAYHRTTPHFHRYATDGLYTVVLEREVETLLAVEP